MISVIPTSTVHVSTCQNGLFYEIEVNNVGVAYIDLEVLLNNLFP